MSGDAKESKIGFCYSGMFEGSQELIKTLLTESLAGRGQMSKRKLRTLLSQLLGYMALGMIGASELDRMGEFLEFLKNAQSKL